MPWSFIVMIPSRVNFTRLTYTGIALLLSRFGERAEAIDVVLGRITPNYPRMMTILILNN